jgi:hypothetical protein
MKRKLSTALALALLASALAGCDRMATDREEAASKGATSDRSAPARPASK